MFSNTDWTSPLTQKWLVINLIFVLKRYVTLYQAQCPRYIRWTVNCFWWPGALEQVVHATHTNTFKVDVMNLLTNVCTVSSYRTTLSFIFVTFKRQGTQTQETQAGNGTECDLFKHKIKIQNPKVKMHETKRQAAKKYSLYNHTMNI